MRLNWQKGVMQGYQRILAAGGDGSVNEIVNGLVKAQHKGYGSAALGIISNGRGNDFGYAMKIPRDLKKSIQLIQRDRRMKIDIGLLKYGGKQRYFCNGAGIGFDAAISATYASKSRLTGFSSYAMGLLKAIFRDFRQEMCRIETPAESFEFPVLFLAVLNGKREGGGFVLAPDFDVQDGLLDVCVVGKGKTLPQLLPLIPRFFSGNLDHPDILTLKTPWIKGEVLGEGFHGQADGEVLFESGRDFYAEIAAEQIELIVEGSEDL